MHILNPIPGEGDLHTPSSILLEERFGVPRIPLSFTFKFIILNIFCGVSSTSNSNFSEEDPPKLWSEPFGMVESLNVL